MTGIFNFRFTKIFKPIAFAGVMVLFSCSQVKFVPENKYLISKVQVEIDNDIQNLNKETAKSLIKQKENYKILGFLKFHLFLYNLSSKKKTEDWLKRIGEPPQIYDEDLSARSEDQLKQYARSKGYFRAAVNSSVEVKENKRRVILNYKLLPGEQYNIKKINYQIKDPVLRELYFNSSIKTEIEEGDAFDIDAMEKHQQNIVELYRNNGYYYFSKDDVKFIADSSVYSKQVLVDLLIRPSKNSQSDTIKVFQPFYLNHFFYSVLPAIRRLR